MTRKLICAMAGLLAMNVMASAADMPIKARPAPLPLFYGGSGTYWLMETGVEQTKVGTALAPGAVGGSLYAAGANMSLGFGYTRAAGPDSWWAVEGKVNATNADAVVETAIGPANVKRRYSFDLQALYGAPLSRLGLLFSNAGVAFGSLPPVCAGAVDCIAQNVHPFILVGMHYGQSTTQIMDVVVPGLAVFEETHNKLRFDAGVGAMVQINASTVWRTTAKWSFGSQNKGAGFLFVPGAPVSEGGTLTATTGFAYAFGI